MNKKILIADKYLAAYAEKNLQDIANLISADVALQDWNISGKGAEFFLAETRKNFDAAEDIVINIKAMHESDSAVAAQLQILLNRASIEIDVVDVISINDDGLITSIRAYKG